MKHFNLNKALGNSWKEVNYKTIMIGTLCPYCNNVLTKENITMDHIIPKSHHSKVVYNQFNTMACCFDCNLRKGNNSLLFFLGLLYDEKAMIADSKRKGKRRQFIRKEVLERLSGIKVKVYKLPNNLVYEFIVNGRAYTSFQNYDLALNFAQRYRLSQQQSKDSKNG